MDRRVVETLCGALSGHPAGVQTIAVSVQEEPETIEDVVEPYLIRLGLVVRTPRGRLATAAAYRHLGRTPPPGRPRLRGGARRSSSGHESPAGPLPGAATAGAARSHELHTETGDRLGYTSPS